MSPVSKDRSNQTIKQTPAVVVIIAMVLVDAASRVRAERVTTNSFNRKEKAGQAEAV